MSRRGFALAGVGLAVGAGFGASVGEYISNRALDGVPQLRADIAACAGRLGVGETTFSVSGLPVECDPYKSQFDTITTIVVPAAAAGAASGWSESLTVPSKDEFVRRAEATLPTREGGNIAALAMTAYGAAIGTIGTKVLLGVARRRRSGK